MLFHENRLLADDSHEISLLIFFENWVRFCKICRLLQLWLALKGLKARRKIYSTYHTNDRIPRHSWGMEVDISFEIDFKRQLAYTNSTIGQWSLRTVVSILSCVATHINVFIYLYCVLILNISCDPSPIKLTCWLCEGVVLLRCEISLKVICEKVKFSNCDFCNKFRDFECTYLFKNIFYDVQYVWENPS